MLNHNHAGVLKIANINGNIFYSFEFLGVPVIVSNMYLIKKHLFHNDISPHFKFLFSNESLDFCDFFLIIDQKVKQINFHSLL